MDLYLQMCAGEEGDYLNNCPVVSDDYQIDRSIVMYSAFLSLAENVLKVFSHSVHYEYFFKLSAFFFFFTPGNWYWIWLKCWFLTTVRVKYLLERVGGHCAETFKGHKQYSRIDPLHILEYIILDYITLELLY